MRSFKSFLIIWFITILSYSVMIDSKSGDAKNIFYSGADASPVRVLDCYDGDTCTVIIQDKFRFKARLAGIDAPETSKRNRPSQPLSEEAKERARELLVDKEIKAEQVGIGYFNRPLLIFYSESGQDINLMLIKEGLAECYKEGTWRKSIYCEHEKIAKDQMIGIWGLRNYISPKVYRKGR